MTPETNPYRSFPPTRFTLSAPAAAACLGLLFAGSATAQSTDAAATPSETVRLNPFEVSTRKDVGYKSTNSASVTRLDAPTRELPLSVQILNEELIGDVGKSSLYDLARYFAGGDNQGAIHQPTQFKLRGTNSGDDDQQRDGFRFIGLTDVYNLERIEIIRGPNSVVHGTADPGGQVNVITKSALPHQDFQALSVRFGSHELIRGALDVNASGTIAGRDVALRVNAVREEKESFIKFVESRGQGLAVAGKVRLGQNTELAVKVENLEHDQVAPVNVVDRWSGAPGYFGGISQSLNRPVPRIYAYDEGNAVGGPDNTDNRELTVALAEVTQRLGERASLKLQAQRARENRVFQEATGSSGALGYSAATDTFFTTNRWQWRDITNDRYNLRAIATYDLELGWMKQSLLAGYSLLHVEAREKRDLLFDDATNTQTNLIVPLVAGQLTAERTRIDFTGRSWRAQTPSASTVESPSYYVSANGSYWNGRLRTLLGYSWNKAEREDDVFATPAGGGFHDGLAFPTATGRTSGEQSRGVPIVSAVVALTPHLNVYGTYSESFKPQTQLLPTLDVATGRIGGTLEPSFGEGVEFGVKFDLLDERLSGTLGVYETKKGNLPQLVDTILVQQILGPNEDRRFYVPGSEQESKGVELELFYNPSPNLTLSLNYAYCDAHVTANPAQPEQVGRVANVHSRNILNVAGKYTFTRGPLDGFFAGGNVFARSKHYRYQSIESGANPGFAVFGLLFGYHGRFGDVRYSVQLNIDNLLDKEYLRTYGVLGEPRSFSVSGTLQF
ncbi:MAG TPA: TonB-dependent receptor plug domain-containing protein [Opitutaceae bacterium]